VIVLKNGALLVAYTEFSSGWDIFSGQGLEHVAARVCGKISSDGGKTWGRKFILAQTQEGLRSAVTPSFLRLNDGRIMFGHNKMVSLGDARYFVRFSADEGKSWSNEIRVIDRPEYGFVYNFGPIQLKSDRILAPYGFSPDYRKDKHFRVKVYYSDDGGQNWKHSSSVTDLPKRGAMDPGVVELKDGSILMYMRTQLGRIYKCYSYDQGLTWNHPEPMMLKNPESPSAMARIPSTNDLIVIFNNNYDPGSPHLGARRPLTAAISLDEGKTWRNFHDLENDRGREYSYPSVTFMNDRVLLTYYKSLGQGNQSKFDFVFNSIPIKWFYE
jgi:sialidase-1